MATASTSTEATNPTSFEFLDPLEDATDNGLYFNNIYLPVEVVSLILSYVESAKILNLSLVCRKWNNMIKSSNVWYLKYVRAFHKKPKKVPWYLYYALFGTDIFSANLLKNGNGQNGFDHWIILRDGGDCVKVEEIPEGADPLPTDVEEFCGHTSCFATSFEPSEMWQVIEGSNSRLFKWILSRIKPDIYVSEWFAGRFDCGCKYVLQCSLYGNNFIPPKPYDYPQVCFFELDDEYHDYVEDAFDELEYNPRDDAEQIEDRSDVDESDESIDGSEPGAPINLGGRGGVWNENTIYKNENQINENENQINENENQINENELGNNQIEGDEAEEIEEEEEPRDQFGNLILPPPDSCGHHPKNYPLRIQKSEGTVVQWEGKVWMKESFIVKDYPDNVTTIVFQHLGCDTQFWKGHYGAKMAGGVVRLLFDSIKEL